MKTDFLGYMHTMDGQPASFDPNWGGYIHYAQRGGCKLVRNLRVIRKQQNIDAKKREYGQKKSTYGYIRVYAALKQTGVE